MKEPPAGAGGPWLVLRSGPLSRKPPAAADVVEAPGAATAAPAGPNTLGSTDCAAGTEPVAAANAKKGPEPLGLGGPGTAGTTSACKMQHEGGGGGRRAQRASV